MSDLIEPPVRKLITALVKERIAAIAAGDRSRIDATYCPHQLRRRNDFNGHDYDLYCRAIETGFGAEVSQFEILPFDAAPDGISISHLPFDDTPEYIVIVSTVKRRTTAWCIDIGIDEDEPGVMLPAFNGRFSDTLGAGGDWASTFRKSRGQPQAEDAPADAVVLFDEDAFAAELAKRIFLELHRVAPFVQLDKVRALAIDCMPYHSRLELSILTDRETFPADDDDAKWETEMWRFQDFASTGKENWPGAQDLIQHMRRYRESVENTESDEQIMAADEAIRRACAKALLHPQVAEGLRRFKIQLADDFEFGAWDPDYQEAGNYCDIIREESTGDSAS